VNVLLIADPFIRVPPVHYGGIERVVADLADGLVERGHQVTLWAAPGSTGRAKLAPFGREGEWTRWSNVRNTLTLTQRLIRSHARFDLVHNFGRLAYLAGVLGLRLPKVQSYQRPVDPRNMQRARRLGATQLRYVAVSAAIRETGRPGGGEWAVIPNGTSPARMTFTADVDPRMAPLVFLGRLDRCKGAHTAIAVARRLERRLIIAGNVSTLPHEREYYEREIAPQVDGDLITYVGEVDDRAKSRLLQRAAALLMPVEWEEPFGIVIVEALMSGTPVIAFRRGGIPEIVIDGRTGLLCDTIDEMVGSVERLPFIDRAACRADAERRFSNDAVVSAYEQLYEEMIGSGR
jgi:glycosyltransferase involved in cell wall biosynthesis